MEYLLFMCRFVSHGSFEIDELKYEHPPSYGKPDNRNSIGKSLRFEKRRLYLLLLAVYTHG